MQHSGGEKLLCISYYYCGEVGGMMTTKQLYFFIGTTAELIKLAPVIKELNRRKTSYKIITSGQNVVRFNELAGYIGSASIYYGFKQRPIGIRLPLTVGFIIWSVKAVVNYFLFFRHELRGRDRYDTYFIVHGDTVSSLLGAIIARIFHVTLVHVESGLRSHNFLEPFPEEMCRYIVSILADIHFCPNDWCKGNLAFVGGEKITTGENTLIETFWYAMKTRSDATFVKRIKKMRQKYCVLVAHRQEHVLFNKAKTEETVTYALGNMPQNMLCVFVVHDLSTSFVESLWVKMGNVLLDRVIFTRTLPYIDYMHLLKDAEFIVTDGGSNQEEMYYMGKPCLLFRNRTERTEGLGRNVVLSKNKKSAITNFLQKYKGYRYPPVKTDIHPSKIIADYLVKR